jgi:hypothetical protein
MTLLFKFVNTLGGFVGAPGVNVMYFTEGTATGDPQAAANSMYSMQRTFYSALQTNLVSGVTIAVAPVVQIVDVATGAIQDEINISSPAADIVGNNSNNQAPRSLSCCASLRTDIFLGGKRLTGRHFLGPLASNTLDTSGQIHANTATAIGNAYTAMISGPGVRLAVFSRPGHRNGGTGQYGDVVNVIPRRVPTNLRSRIT